MYRRRRVLWILLLLTIITPVFFVALASAQADGGDAHVRVGWYESPFNATDGNGRRSGYAYEYQRKIAAYTGWEYTYVSGSWPDLMQMLADGEIDLMSDVSYTGERAERMLFSDFSMGTEEYCVFITPDEQTITPEDYSTLNGKRIGVNKGSIQLELFLKWAETHGVQADAVELTTTEVDSVDMLEAGKLDALASNSGIQLRMGVMPWQKDMPPQQLMEEALIACNLARGYFKDHLVIFDDKAREREAFEHRLEGDLRRAIDNREFVVHYQPKYDIQAEPPTLKSAEALVRWRHPELGMIPPGEFIPLFERNGQINLVDKYVWAEAARQITVWRAQYGVTVPVSVNLSRVDVFDPELERTLDALLAEHHLAHGDLKLEVTESACTENPYQVIDVIERLRKKGFEIEMDDFGSGYSSLNMLSTMPIDVLKMDRVFVSNIEHNAKDIQLVELILGIARNLKVPVIAEGVETEAQLELLKEMGCALVQGFYFSRPLPASEFGATVFKRKD